MENEATMGDERPWRRGTIVGRDLTSTDQALVRFAVDNPQIDISLFSEIAAAVRVEVEKTNAARRLAENDLVTVVRRESQANKRAEFAEAELVRLQGEHDDAIDRLGTVARAYQDESERLRSKITEAPHHYPCQAEVLSKARCTCWKNDAL